MWKEKLLTLLSSLDKKQLLSAVLFLLGFILLSVGLIYSFRSSNSGQVSKDISFEPAGSSPENKNSKITVDVEGAVVSPGIYSLDSSSRIKDALIAAGGLASNADRDFVAKNLNLALKLADAAKIYIPKKGENLSANGTGSQTRISLININSASLSELDSLPGIGAVTAQKIIDGRPYQAVDELLSKKIVKSSVFEKIKDKISIY